MSIPKIELSEREAREYNLAAAILRSTSSDPDQRTGIEFEISAEIAKRSPEQHGGLHVPHTMYRAGLDTATATKGQELKFTKGYTFIEALRNKSAVLRAGAIVLDNLTADAAIPKQVNTATAQWIAQNGGTDVSESNATFASVGLTPHVLVATTSYSRGLLAQANASEGVDQIVRSDLAKVHGTAIDEGALAGTGTSNQPTGLFNRGDIGAQTIAFGTNGAHPTWALITAFEKLVAVGNGEVDPFSGAYIVTPEMRNTLRTTDRTTGTTGWFILPDNNGINGFPVIATNQLPKTLTKGTGTNLHGIAYADWSEMLIGLWGGFEIVADPFRLKKQGMIELTSYQLADTSVRHIAGFAVSVDALP